MDAITIRGLRKAYDGRAAVDGLDLDIHTGEVFALLGPNGAGKTTTVEILEGFRRRDDGEVTVLGADLGALLSGAVVTEGIFNIPGLGRAVFQAIQSQEGNVVVGIVTLFVFVYIVFNLLVDVMYAALDPRIRVS